jgi:uncharacterized protein (DUF1501 family)
MTDATKSTSIFANRFTRRRFVQYSAAGAGIVAISPYLTKLQAFAAPPVADNQGILVTIQLGGGNDGMNMVAPVGDPKYAALRPSLKVAGTLSLGSGLAFHPSLVKLKARYSQGRVAVVRGVGYDNPDLSHFTSTDIWTRGWGGTGTPSTGWIGRWLDHLPNTAHESLYGVSLHGDVKPHLAGAVSHASSLPLSIGDAFGIDRTDPSDAHMYNELGGLASAPSGLGPLGDLYDTTESELMALTQRIKPAYGFTMPSTDIGQQLALAAHLINANLGIRVFDVSLDGFDTHSDQASWHATLLSQLDNAIDAFYAALSARWRGQVALMTWSEFGRRPEENGDAGTDHGTASPLLVIGDHVRGGLHSTQPSLTDLDDNGNLKNHTDFRAVYASILHTWLGADDQALLGRTYAAPALFASPPAAPMTAGDKSSWGFWLVGVDGTVHACGGARKFGSITPASWIIAGVATKSRLGMWLVDVKGNVYTFGDAHYHGGANKLPLNKPIVGMAATATGNGYWLCASDGGIFSYGDAHYYGSTGGLRLNKPIVSMTASPTGKGYWFCAGDGGIFTFGDAKYHGSTGGSHLTSPVVNMAATPTGKGYWLAAANGAVYPFGDAKGHGGASHPATPICGIAPTLTGNGYWLAEHNGTAFSYGDATVLSGVHASTQVLVRA